MFVCLCVSVCEYDGDIYRCVCICVCVCVCSGPNISASKHQGKFLSR